MLGPMTLRDSLRARVPLVTRRRLAQWQVRSRRPTSRWRGLPDALVIGAQRSGTSTLFRHLARHPEAAASRRKEVEYFSRYHAEGEQWYRAHFALSGGRRRVSFEATPDYLFHPLAARRAAALLPDARLVVMLRDPVERAWSHHRHMVALGYEDLRFDDALDAELARCAPGLARLAVDPLHVPLSLLRFSYAARGHYAEQLRRWLEVYPRSSLLVIRSEDFFADPAVEFARVVDHLGLRPWQPDEFVNVSRADGDHVRPQVPGEVRHRLAATFDPTNAQLVELLGPDAPRW